MQLDTDIRRAEVTRMENVRATRRWRGRWEARDQARCEEEKAAAQEALECPPDNEMIDLGTLPPSSAPYSLPTLSDPVR